MKKITFVLLLVSILGGLTNLSAQGKRIPDAPFQENLWYGFGVGLGFSSVNNFNQFTIGVSPMVGYKFLGPLSAGPRASIFYSSLKVPQSEIIHTFDYEFGAFLRGHIYRGFFLQGELSQAWGEDINAFTLDKFTYSRFDQLIGAGLNFGRGGWGSELMLMYNIAIANDINASAHPISYRFNFTYRF